MTLQPASVANLALSGVAIYLTLHNIPLAQGPRGRPEHGLIAAFCGLTLLLFGGRIVQYEADTIGAAVVGLKLATTATLLMFPVLLSTVLLILGRRARVGLVGVVTALGLIESVVLWTTDWLFLDAGRLWADGLGQTYYWIDPGPILPILGLQATPLLLYCTWLIWTDTVTPNWIKVPTVAGLMWCVSTGANDLAISQGWYPGVILFEFGFIGLAVAFDAVLVGRFHILQQQLEEAVAERTAALVATNDELSAALHIAEGADRAKSTFIRQMGHELRSPLTALLGFGELIVENARERRDADLEEDALEIVMAGKSLSELLENALEVAKSQGDEADVKRTPVDLRVCTAWMADRFRAEMAEAQQELHVEFGGDLGVFMLPKRRVSRVLERLLENVVRHAGPAQVTLAVRAYTASESIIGGGLLEWRVVDDGEGITPADAEILFEPFARRATSSEDPAVNANSDGTRLGLAAARSAARAIGGDLRFQPRPDGGAEFVLELPAVRAVAAQLSS